MRQEQDAPAQRRRRRIAAGHEQILDHAGQFGDWGRILQYCHDALMISDSLHLKKQNEKKITT